MTIADRQYGTIGNRERMHQHFVQRNKDSEVCDRPREARSPESVLLALSSVRPALEIGSSHGSVEFLDAQFVTGTAQGGE
jgi:hypothetical protein